MPVWAQYQHQWPVVVLCAVLEVRRSGFYPSVHRHAPTKREAAEAALVVRVKAIAAATRSSYGSRRMAHDGKKVVILLWDNASWHRSKIVRKWRTAHNQRVKREDGCRLILCPLPTKRPWLNPIEPRWVHGKRAILEPTRLLTAQELIERVCIYYGCENFEPITQQVR